jgi:hypothetical protein
MRSSPPGAPRLAVAGAVFILFLAENNFRRVALKY